jgi:diacylglycerol kinase family enzyme
MKLLVLLNELSVARSGHPPKLIGDWIVRGFTEANVQSETRLCCASALASEAQSALVSEVDGIVVGGGDGTVNAVVNAIADGDKLFGVLPLGSHNHFARHLGMPAELDQAVAALARAQVIEIPLFEVNGRIFLSCMAIGMNPPAKRDGWAMSVARAVANLTGRAVKHVRVRARGRTLAADTNAVIVCNNRHQMELLGVHAADAPEGGLLNVYVASTPKRRKRLGVLPPRFLPPRFLPPRKGTGHAGTHFSAMALPDLRIDSPRRRIAVSIDGESCDLNSPLHFQVRPRPLRVLAPAVVS